MALSKEDKDCWRTPPYVFNALNSEYDFGLDVCANSQNTLCERYIDSRVDALIVDWREYMQPGKTWAFCNPPYSNVAVFIAKAREMQRVGIGTVMLVNNNTDTHWFHESGATLVLLLQGRIKFLHPLTGEEGKQPSRGNMLLIYNPHWPEGWATEISTANLDDFKHKPYANRSKA